MVLPVHLQPDVILGCMIMLGGYNLAQEEMPSDDKGKFICSSVGNLWVCYCFPSPLLHGFFYQLEDKLL